MDRIFILSPAQSGGERASQLLHPKAAFPLARQIRADAGVPLGEVFSFLSGLYFRGKYIYARAFARPPRGLPGSLVITANRGLLPADASITTEDLRAFGTVPIDSADPRYTEPLERDARLLSEVLSAKCEVVFLGSISTKKYVELLLPFFGERLRFPLEFLGRGDMSRGGLLLRAAADQQELAYIPLLGAVRRGKRPPKLPPRKWAYKILSGKTELSP